MIICGLLLWLFDVLMLVVGWNVRGRSADAILLSLLWAVIFLMGYDLIAAGLRLRRDRRRDDTSRR